MIRNVTYHDVIIIGRLQTISFYPILWPGSVDGRILSKHRIDVGLLISTSGHRKLSIQLFYYAADAAIIRVYG